jgi:hypothetical protein
MRHHIIFIALTFVASAAFSSPLSPAEVVREVRRFGARGAVARIFASRQDEERLLHGIASGNEAWIRAAVRLMPGLDAHPGEAVGSSLGSALKHNPSAVLTLAPPAFRISEICSGPDVDEYEHLAPAIKELRARQIAVHSIAMKALHAQREECLSALAASEKPLRAFFVNP